MTDFYLKNDEIEIDLRLGDILTGFTFPKYEANDINLDNFSLKFEKYKYYVVLTPCCSIEKKQVTLSPLIKVKTNYLLSSELKSNPTLTNSICPNYYIIPDDNPKKKSAMENPIVTRVDYSFFVFSSNSLLDKYCLSYKDTHLETNFYMIDFKNVFVLNSDFICRNASNQNNKELHKYKLLQLTIASRDKLRDKLTFFYNRVAEEDIPEILDK